MGSIILASGQGRAGYVVLHNRMTPVSSRAAVRADLPGTVAVLRFSTRRVRARRIARTVESAAWKVNVAYVTGAEAIGADLSAVEDVARKVAAVTRSPLTIEMPYRPPSRLADPAEPRVIIVHFSFETIRDAQRLLSVLSSLPAQYVATVVFADIPPAARTELRAYTKDWSAVTSGVPRRLLLWDPSAQGLCWQIGGELPASTHCQKLYLDLEQSGHVGRSVVMRVPEEHRGGSSLPAGRSSRG